VGVVDVTLEMLFAGERLRAAFEHTGEGSLARVGQCVALDEGMKRKIAV
jgi:hypothetical protein